jgi:predicted nucleic acid-binding protein
MPAVVDSGAIYALYDADDAHHARVRAAVEREPGPLIAPSALLAEADYLLRELLGIDAELHFIDDLKSGFFTLVQIADADLDRCRAIIDHYRDSNPGLVDAVVMATAERLGINRILTVDERHFRMVRSSKGSPFVLLPADVT